MTFLDWLYSRYPENSACNGRYGVLHISVMVGMILLSFLIYFLFRKSTRKSRENVIKVLAILVLIFEITRRIINISRGITDFDHLLYVLLPRPWCAISCWFLIFTAFIKKPSLYNFTSANALLCALIFFSYPSVGFNDKYILFENVYSIGTHALLFISAVSSISLGLTNFEKSKNNIVPSVIMLLSVFAYAFIEIFWLKVEPDPLYFMSGNDVQAFLGVNYSSYLIIYVLFLSFYFSIFYIVQYLINKFRNKKEV